MKLEGKSILLVSPEPWNHIKVSKHHYAIHLAKKGNKVWFLNPPGSVKKKSDTDYEHLFELDYKGFFPLLRFFPRFFRKLFTKMVFRRLERQVNARFDLIWSFDSSVFFQLDALPSSVIKISHIVDLNQNFELRKAFQTANICLCSSQAIRNSVAKFAKPHVINHGLNLNGGGSFGSPFQLAGKNQLKAVYAGNLAMRYLDWEILLQAAETNLDIDFIFFGSNAENLDCTVNATHRHKSRVKELFNTYFPGRLDSDELMIALSSADLLLVCYQEEHHLDQSNPHKILEYLYTGKPIVATYTAEYTDTDLLYMSDRNVDWPSLFKRTVENLRNGKLDVASQRQKQYALNNTYDKQIERIEQLLEK